MPNTMSMSPQVDQYSQSPPAEQAEQLFKERFTKMAFSVLFAKFSELAPHVVTFKILETKPDEGRGVGAFIVMYNQHPVYIPVVLIDGQLKPMDVFYYKELNLFLPLTTQWLEEVSKMSLDDMGQGAQLPQQVAQDVNIRDLILPPLTSSGRIGYASDQSLDFGAKQMFKEAEDHHIVNPPQFLNLIQHSPTVVLDGLKLAFTRHPRLLQKIASVYGIQKVTEAFNRGYAQSRVLEKKATIDTGALEIFTKFASTTDLHRAFGDQKAEAFATIVKQGYAVKDTRQGINKVAVKVEAPTFLAEPGAQPGWYKLFFLEGVPEIYYVIPFPIKGMSRKSRHYLVSDYANREHRAPVEYLLLSADLKRCWCADDVVGMPIHDLSKVKDTAAYKLLNGASGNQPKIKAFGFFVNTTLKGVEATAPFEITRISSDSGQKVIENYGDKYVIDGLPSRKNFDVAQNGRVMFIPDMAKWVTLFTVPEKYDDRPRMERTSLIHDPKLISRWLGDRMQEFGATPVTVKSAGLDLWWVGANAETLAYPAALRKVACDYSIPVADARGILQDAQLHGQSSAVVVDVRGLRQVKLALEGMAQGMPPQGMPPQGMPPQGMPPQGMPPQGMDPSQMGMPPAPPPPMSPTDLALGEAMQQLTQQNELQTQQTQAQMQQMQTQMQMQMQANQQLISVLQGIQQRAQQLSSATGGQIPQGAEASPQVAAQAIAPVPEQPPEEPPTPMMTEEPFTAETVASQINPEMVDQASELMDNGVFDTAAVAMMAGVTALQDLVANYIPNLETALDNLGRIIVTLAMKEPETKRAIGEESFVTLEDKLRAVHKGLGDTILQLSHNAQSTQTEQQTTTSQTANA